MNGLITNELCILFQPPNNFYWNQFIGIHHITPAITQNAPTFDKIWHKIEPYIKNQNVVAHNGLCFDFPVLAQTLEYYRLEVPEYEKHCTYKIFRDNLASLCHNFKITLTHHDALSDAKACAELFLIHLNN